MIFILFGLWNITLAFIVMTPNIRSAIAFRVIPFACGSYLVLFGLQQYGVI